MEDNFCSDSDISTEFETSFNNGVDCMKCPPPYVDPSIIENLNNQMEEDSLSIRQTSNEWVNDWCEKTDTIINSAESDLENWSHDPDINEYFI